MSEGKLGAGSPTVSDSVMTEYVNAAFGCSPQPLDVMVMYALYQSR